MRASLVAGAALAMSFVSAYADGYQGRYQPAYAPFSWTGLYIGVDVGGAWGDTKAIDQLATNGAPWNKLGDTFTAKTDGVTAGGTIGYNWQHSNLVFGFEGDVGYLGARGTGTSSISSDTHDRSDGGVVVTARGRLGFAFDRTLVYGTGGYIGADLRSRVFDNIGTTLHTSDAGFQSGWTVGGGIEHSFGRNWSGKVEYHYYDLGRDRVGPAVAVGHNSSTSRTRGISFVWVSTIASKTITGR
jgi:outer membrane immunogenic protein